MAFPILTDEAKKLLAGVLLAENDEVLGELLGEYGINTAHPHSTDWLTYAKLICQVASVVCPLIEAS